MAENIVKLQQTKAPLNEIGVAGLKHNSGYLFEEFHPKLRGTKALKVYQEMANNDATIGGILAAIGLVIRAVKWHVEPAGNKPQAKREAEFVESLLDDMSHSWSDFISEALTMLPYGWSYFETVYKVRSGSNTDPSVNSKFTDGRIGLRKLAPRPQDTLDKWELQDDGGILGMWQNPVNIGTKVFIPISRAILLRTVSNKNSPEGKSILRNAYRAWYKLNYIEDYEAIGIERELTGLPIVSIPSEVLNSTDPTQIAMRQQYEAIARDLKFNNQAGLVIPSDTFPTAEDSPSAIPLVNVKLLSSGGTRTIDTDKVVNRYQRSIARSCLADFLMVGEGSSARGSYAMYIGKEGLFLRACEAVLKQIADPLNRYLLPRIWKFNNLNPKLLPEITFGQVAPPDLTELGQYINNLASAGAVGNVDEPLVNRLRQAAMLPENQGKIKQIDPNPPESTTNSPESPPKGSE